MGNSPNILPASCGIRDRDGLWVHRVIGDWVFEAKAWPEQSAFASRRKIRQSGDASLRSEIPAQPERFPPALQSRSRHGFGIRAQCGGSDPPLVRTLLTSNPTPPCSQ